MAPRKQAATAGETPVQKTAAARAQEPDGSQEPAETTETPPKVAKRGRPAKSAAADDAADGSAPKRQKAAAAAKPDKNAPLKRSPTPRELAPPSGRVLRLLSVNVAGLRAVLNGEKAGNLRALVEREAPDVLCLNEHKLKESDVAEVETKLKELLPKEYATMHWACSTAKKGYAGVAMLLRSQPESSASALPPPASLAVTKGMGGEFDKDPVIEAEGRVLTLDLPALSVVATYVPNSGLDLKRLDYRVNREAEQCWDRSLGSYVRQLRESKGKPVVVLGDLNCGHRVQDIWNMYERPDFPQGLSEKPVADQYVGLSTLKKFAGLTPQERESFPKMLEEADLVDTFRAIYPDASGVFSYFSMKVAQNRPMNHGLRLDYVLASSSMCTQLKPRRTVEGAGDSVAKSVEAAEPPAQLPQIYDSFILDEDDLVADHAAVGCHILLPPAASA